MMPSGALYMMVGVELDKFPHITTAVDFMEKLMLEESVYILPGEVCNALLPTVCKSFFHHVVFPISWFYEAGVADAKH